MRGSSKLSSRNKRQRTLLHFVLPHKDGGSSAPTDATLTASAPHSSSTPASSAKYTECPVCSCSIPSSFLSIHIQSCLGQGDRKGGPDRQGDKKGDPDAYLAQRDQRGGPDACLCQRDHRRGPGAGVSPSDADVSPSDADVSPSDSTPTATSPAATTTSAQAAPATQGATKEAAVGTAASAAAAAAATEGGATVTRAAAKTAADQYADPELQGLEGEGDMGAESHPAESGTQLKRNAFESLMQAQRIQSRVECFYLELTEEGQWCWHWYVKGCRSTEVRPLPPAAWSATVSIALDKSASSAGQGKRSAPQAKTTLQLTSNVQPGAGGAVTWEADLPSNHPPQEGRWSGSPSMLKSGLQKAVRLGRGSCAVRLALQMVKDDPSELLRRLPIICLEDSILHPAFPLLVWLMVAQSKGYTLGALHVSTVLQITFQIAQAKVRDFIPPSGPNNHGPPSKATIDSSVPPEAAIPIKCMLLRASYGGMECDMRMLKGYAAGWMQRCSTEETSSCWLTFLSRLYELCPPPGELSSMELVGPLRRGDIPLSAVDFHVSEIIPHLMSSPKVLGALRSFLPALERGEMDDEDWLKQAMWHLRSGLNVRRWMLPSPDSDPYASPITTLIFEQATQLVRLQPTYWAAHCAALQRHVVGEANTVAVLRPLWAAAAGEADAFSSRAIGKRFQK